MSGKPDEEVLSRERILDRNPRIDASVVAEFEELERELNLLGVEIKPRYSLEPALGGTRRQLRNRDA